MRYIFGAADSFFELSTFFFVGLLLALLILSRRFKNKTHKNEAHEISKGDENETAIEIQRVDEGLRAAKIREAEEPQESQETEGQLDVQKESYEKRREKQQLIARLKRHEESERRAHEQRIMADTEAKYQSGRKFYEAGDYVNAIIYYRKAAERNHAEAQYSLGAMYENGDGVSQNLSEALKWYIKATENGHESAKSAVERLKRT